MSKQLQWIILGILVLFLVVLVAAFKPVVIKGPAMEPTYKNGTNYLVNKLSYLLTKPQRGDIIAYHYTQSLKYLGIGRIIGLPGEKIKIQDGKVYINNTILQENYVSPDAVTEVASKSEIKDVSDTTGKVQDTNAPKILDEGKELLIPENNYFMMGDNREQSIDSRSLGMIEYKDIIGQMAIKYKLPF